MLAGLSNAPQYMVRNFESLEKGCILASDVDSVILPIDACGGDGALAFANARRNKVHTLCPRAIWPHSKMTCSDLPHPAV